MTRGRVCLAWAVTGLCAASLPACLHRGEPRQTPDEEHVSPPTPRNQPTGIVRRPIPDRSFPLGVTPPARTAAQPNSFPAPAAEKPKIEVVEIEPIAPGVKPVEPPEAEDDLISALRAYIGGQPDRAIRQMARLDEVNQQALLRLLPVVVELTRDGPTSTEPENRAVMIEQLHEAADVLRTHAALKTGTVCFCRNVNEFGDYTPIGKKPSFRSGERVDVYLELRNFSNEEPVAEDRGPGRGVGRRYRNSFRFDLTLRDASGTKIHEIQQWQTYYGWTPRRERHFGLGFNLPGGMASGRYTLTVTIEDEPTGRKARRSLELWVGGLG